MTRTQKPLEGGEPGDLEITFTFDMTSCTFCGLCSDFCARKAITLTDDYMMTGTTAEDFLVTGSFVKKAPPVKPKFTPEQLAAMKAAAEAKKAGGAAAAGQAAGTAAPQTAGAAQASADTAGTANAAAAETTAAGATAPAAAGTVSGKAPNAPKFTPEQIEAMRAATLAKRAAAAKAKAEAEAAAGAGENAETETK